MKKTLLILLTLTLLAINVATVARPPMEGLENNDEYTELLTSQQQLAASEDSLNNELVMLRERFRENPKDRNTFASEILRIEGEIFEVRNRTGIISGRISAIEQEHLLTILPTPDTSEPANVVERESASRQNPDLVSNEIFSRNLDADMLLDLHTAQSNERTADSLAQLFYRNYRDMVAVEQQNRLAATAPIADSLYIVFSGLQGENILLGEELSSVWNPVFDEKWYIYNYLAEKLGNTSLTAQASEMFRTTTDRAASGRGLTESDEVNNYRHSKDLLLWMESQIASDYHLHRAEDSLRNAIKTQEKRPSIDRIDFVEKLFLDFEPVNTRSAFYNARNPIPEVIVYPRGTIYRIVLGTYGRAQPVSVFKGLYPLFLSKDTASRVTYYAGGYPTYTAAEDDLIKAKNAGFRNPKIAVWINGEYNLLDSAPVGTQSAHYTVTISTADGSLPVAAGEIIKDLAPGKDIARSGDNFIVGPFEASGTAAAIATSLAQIPGVSAQVVSVEVK